MDYIIGYEEGTNGAYSIYHKMRAVGTVPAYYLKVAEVAFTGRSGLREADRLVGHLNAGAKAQRAR